MPNASEPKGSEQHRASRSRAALAVAWLALAALLAAAGGYLVFERHTPRSAALTLALPEVAPEAEAPAPGPDEGPPAEETAETSGAMPLEEPSVPGTATSPEAEPPAAPPSVAEPALPSAPEAPRQQEAPAAAGEAEQAPPAAQAPAAQSAAEQAPAEPEATSGAPASPADQANAPAAPQVPGGEQQATLPPPEAAGQTREPQQPQQQQEDAQEPPWRRFSTPVAVAEGLPRIAVVVVGLGFSSAATEAAIKQLPAQVTLSFSPYGRKINEWVALARANGHEVMVDLPMEPLNFPNLDPGPHALRTDLAASENLERLDWVLDRATSYVGVTAMMGSRFIASEEALHPVLEELHERGLLFFDNRVISHGATKAVAERIGMPLLMSDRTIDEAQASRLSIDARLAQIERLAQTNGRAVALGQPYPVTLERLRAWTMTLAARGFALVPITALVPGARSG